MVKCEEVAAACLEVLCRRLYGETEENYEKSRSG